ncbi:MAG: hypothetical protein EOL87_04515 [Spartobacteria bacterium]|nr:hypothetical protein [Spartobacteria bacterium]
MTAKKDHIVLDAKLCAVIHNDVFEAELGNGHRFVAYFKKKRIGKASEEQLGQQVKVEFSTFDMSKGKIIGG